MPTDEVPEMVEDMMPTPKKVVNMISVGFGPDTWVTVWGVDSLKETEEVFLRTFNMMQKKASELRKDTKAKWEPTDVG